MNQIVPGLHRRLLFVGLLVLTTLAVSVFDGGGRSFQAPSAAFADTELNATHDDLNWRGQIPQRLTAVGSPPELVGASAEPNRQPSIASVDDNRNPNATPIARPETIAPPWAVKAATARAPPRGTGAA